MAEDLEITDVYDDLRPDELESHQPMDEDRSGMPHIVSHIRHIGSPECFHATYLIVRRS